MWSKNNSLEINTKKTEEIVFTATSPSAINNDTIQQVESFKYLGVMIDCTLLWKHHIDFIYIKKNRLRSGPLSR